jgi:4-hydroxy-4-methyl-2-oxoglutarate aldolase
MAAMDFPVFSRSVTVVGTVKGYPGDLRSPVRIGGIVVHTGDLIVGDADGVIVLPRNAVAETISRADQRVADERHILDQIRNGKTTLELYGLYAEGTFTTR